LSKLSEDSSYDVRRRVALNKSTTPVVLTNLSRDTNNEVREAVAENENTPLAVLVRLASDQDSSAAKTARARTLSQTSWSDDDKEIALGLLDETQAIESGKYFPSLEKLQEAVEDYRSLSKGEGFDPRDTLALDFAFGSAKSK
jgi:hypothetical protein